MAVPDIGGVGKLVLSSTLGTMFVLACNHISETLA